MAVEPVEYFGVQQGATSLENSPDNYFVQLAFFTGPMDLLLHLVNQQEVSIAEVNMSVIAEQFVQIVSKCGSKDLERTTEYLVVAATLLSIKSQSLIPGAVDDEGVPVDQNSAEFLEALRARLQAYELTKLRAQELRAMPQFNIDVFSRRSPLKAENIETPIAEGDTQALGGLFAGLLKRIGAGMSFLKVQLESVSVVQQMMGVLDALQGKLFSERPKSFYQFVRGWISGKDNKDNGRGAVIGSFLAVLELVRRGYVQVEQSDQDGDIKMELRVAPAEGSLQGLVEEEVLTGVEAERADISVSAPDNIVPFVSREEREANKRLEDDNQEEYSEAEVVNRG